LCACICAVWSSAARAAPEQPARLAAHLLDYIAGDYREAVEDGKIKNDNEYKEMLEFTDQVGERVASLPPNDARPDIAAETQRLAELVSGKADASAVASQASRVRGMLVAAYGLEVAPKAVPRVAATAAALYAQHCASCHGAEGRGDGPAATGLDPRPASFQDTERMASRSLYGLYNSISLGVGGTDARFGNCPRNSVGRSLYISTLGVPTEQLKKASRCGVRRGPMIGTQGVCRLAALTTLSANKCATATARTRCWCRTTCVRTRRRSPAANPIRSGWHARSSSTPLAAYEAASTPRPWRRRSAPIWTVLN
jgi:mono/diheme cytochrome c family protein